MCRGRKGSCSQEVKTKFPDHSKILIKTYYPEDEAQVSRLVKNCYDKNTPLELVGTNTKNFIGKKFSVLQNDYLYQIFQE